MHHALDRALHNPSIIEKPQQGEVKTGCRSRAQISVLSQLFAGQRGGAGH
jgi:hypothetical protein